MFHRLFIFLVLSVFAMSTAILSASDREKEKRWAEQISDALLDGEIVMLHDGTAEFVAIDTRADEPKEVGVIVIHGMGIHPDWETVIQPLRVQLATDGWNTLSLQMPVLSNDATGEDYQPLMKEVPARIDAGIRHMTKNGAKKIILVAHSMGASMTSYYLAHKKVYLEAQTQTPITAYIGIGMGAGNIPFIEKIKLPMLDLYGEKDLPNVIASAEKRANAGSHNKGYRQKKVAGANHFFEDQDDDLVKTVTDALRGF